jgi:hypothetical protein
MFKSKAQFIDIGLNLSDAIWMRLQSAMTFAKKRYGNRNDGKFCKTTSEFLDSFKKGSKKFRKIMVQHELRNWRLANLSSVQTYATLTDTEIPENAILTFCLKMWNSNFFPNDLREFLFKERNNCLPLGNRLGHFIENVNERCSFCRIINPETNQRESFTHLFMDCPVTRTALNGFLRINRSWIQGNYPELKNAYWYGIVNGELDKNVGMIFSLFRFCIWKCKIRKKVPTALAVHSLVSTFVRLITTLKPKIYQSILHGNIFANLLQARG